MAGHLITHDGDAVDSPTRREVRAQLFGRGGVVHLPHITASTTEDNIKAMEKAAENL